MHGCAVFSAVVRSLFQALYGLRWRLIWYCVCVCAVVFAYSRFLFELFVHGRVWLQNSSFLSSYWWFALFFCTIPIPFFVCVCESICINISLHSGHKYFFLSFFPCFWIQPLRSVSLLAFLYFFPSIRRFLCNSSSSSDSAYFVDLFVSFMQCKCKHK